MTIGEYPMHDLPSARRSRIQALLDFHNKRLTAEEYTVVRHRLDGRVKELEKEERQAFRPKRPIDRSKLP